MLKVENTLPAVTNSGNLPAAPSGGNVTEYLTDFGVGSSGTHFKFSKDGKFVRNEDDSEIPEGTELAVIYEEIEVGWKKFNGKGNPPDRRMGRLFAGFKMPKREELGDLDPGAWAQDLSGKPADPWQHQVELPLMSANGERFIFNTSSVTGRRAANTVISHCARMAARDPDLYPVVQLKVSGFQHRDDRVGWVKTPAFAIVGKTPKINLAAGKESLKENLNDEIPWIP